MKKSLRIVTDVMDILINPNIPEFTDDCNFCSFVQQQKEIK